MITNPRHLLPPPDLSRYFFYRKRQASPPPRVVDIYVPSPQQMKEMMREARAILKELWGDDLSPF